MLIQLNDKDVETILKALQRAIELADWRQQIDINTLINWIIQHK